MAENYDFKDFALEERGQKIRPIPILYTHVHSTSPLSYTFKKYVWYAQGLIACITPFSHAPREDITMGMKVMPSALTILHLLLIPVHLAVIPWLPALPLQGVHLEVWRQEPHL